MSYKIEGREGQMEEGGDLKLGSRVRASGRTWSWKVGGDCNQILCMHMKF